MDNKRFPRRLLVSIALTALGLAAAYPVVADDFTIDTPVFVTNGGNTLDGDDTLTVTGTGSINPPSGQDGVVAFGVGNTIDNRGVITTTGNNAEAIRTDGLNAVIINSGSIITSGSNSSGVELTNEGTVRNLGSIIIGNSAGILGGDDNQIFNSGTITTSASGTGIAIDRRNVVTNDGVIIMEDGIVALDDNTIINNGSILATGGGGIFADFDNIIINHGTISVTGPQSFTTGNGIFVLGRGTVTNTGLITTSVGGAAGVWLEDNVVLNNSGTIASTGNNWAVWGDTGNTVVNSGLLTASGDFSIGIELDGGTITNTGVISTTGANGRAVRFSNRGGVLSNWGSIIATMPSSLAMSLINSSTANLFAPSFIAGEIVMDLNGTINITSGPSHSILWDLSSASLAGGMPNLMGSVPIFYNQATQQVATFDPTGFVGSANALADTAGNISGLIRSRHDAARRGAESSVEPLGFFPVATTGNGALNALAEVESYSDLQSGGWWMSGFGSWGEYDGGGGALDQTFDQYGFAMGYDAVLSPSLSFGVLGGYGWGSFGSESRFANALSNNVDGVFAALYGQQRMGSATIDFSLAGGALSHSDSRFVNDNLAPLGVSQATASYGSWWLSPEVRVAADFAMGDWVLTPSAQLGYAMQWIEGFTETGPSAANAVVGSRDVATLDARVELSATRQLGFGSLTVRGGWQQRHALGDDGVAVAMLGQTQTVGFDTNLGGGAFVGLQSDIALDDRFLLQVSGEALLGAARTLRASASLRMSF